MKKSQLLTLAALLTLTTSAYATNNLLDDEGQSSSSHLAASPSIEQVKDLNRQQQIELYLLELEIPPHYANILAQQNAEDRYIKYQLYTQFGFNKENVDKHMNLLSQARESLKGK